MTLYSAPNATNIPEFLQYVNRITCWDRSNMTDIAVSCASQNGIFGPIILITIWGIVFMTLKSYSTEKALASASFITAVSSVFLYILLLIPAYVILLPTVVTIVSVFMLRE